VNVNLYFREFHLSIDFLEQKIVGVLTIYKYWYYRLPSPDLWSDIFEKIKGSRFQHRFYILLLGYSPKQEVYDFYGVRDICKLLETAKRYGIIIISRSDSYVNITLIFASDDQHTDYEH
jgi:beta-galactosidase GanA